MDSINRMGDNALKKAANDYAAIGWRVIPIKPASKLPLIKGWQKFASSNPAQIESWWTQWPTANVGVRLGQDSNLIDVECDSDEAEQQLAKLFGGEIPQTACYHGLRGKHRLFRWRGDLPGGAVVHLGAIEVRTGNGGKGAQSVFPPSVHPTGPLYQWIVTPEQCPPIDLPDAILAALWNQSEDDLSPIDPNSDNRMPANERAARYVDQIPAVGEGARNQTCYKVACVLLRDFALDPSEAASILAAYNARCTPPLGEREIAQTLKSAENYGLGVRGSKLEGTPPPRRQKIWEPDRLQGGIPMRAAEADNLDFDVHADMSTVAQGLVAQAIDLTKQASVALLYRSLEAINERLESPLSPNDLKAVFTFALRQERSKRLDETATSVLTNPPGEATDAAAATLAGKKASGVFKLVIVESDPPRYELHAPQFCKAPGKCLVLTAEQMNSASQIRIQALKQAEYPLPKIFDKEWSKAGGIYEAVVHMAEHRKAQTEDKRHAIIAEMLVMAFDKARILEDAEAPPDTRGKPSLYPDGSIFAKFTYLWEPMRRSDDKIERTELSRLLQSIPGIGPKNVRVAGKQHRFMCISPDAVRTLRTICELDD